MPQTLPVDSDEIQQQMAEIRGEMGHDMHTLVQNARTLSDWRYYVRQFPLAAVGAAAAAGFLLAPSRGRAAATTSPASHPQVQAERAQKKGLMGIVIGMAATAALRGASGLATRMATQYFETGKLEIPGFGPKPQPQREGRPHEEPHY